MQKKLFNFATFVAVAVATAVASAQPASFLDLGVIGTEGEFTFDTFGSMTVPMGTGGPAPVDTELALWDALGVLLAENDNGGGTSQSEIIANLATGEYYLGIGEGDAIFGAGFTNSGTGFEAGESANLVLNVDGLFGGTLVGGDDAGGFDETVFFRVEVSAVPEPAIGSVLALAGVLFVRRRR